MKKTHLLNSHTSLDFNRGAVNNGNVPPKVNSEQPSKLNKPNTQTMLANMSIAVNPQPQQTAAMTKKRMQAERAAYRQRMRNELARKQDVIRKEKEFNEKTKIWKEQIIPYWNEMAFSHKVKDLCFKGIPPRIREKVWPLLVGNELHINELMYDKLLHVVQDLFSTVMTASRLPDTTEENVCPSTYILENAYVVTTSYTDSEVDAFGTADIPIPKKSLSIDVTEESWFENERQGSLDQDAFATIQKQLFNHPPSAAISTAVSEANDTRRSTSQHIPILATSIPKSSPVTIPHSTSLLQSSMVESRNSRSKQLASSVDSLVFSPVVSSSIKGEVFMMDDDSTLVQYPADSIGLNRHSLAQPYTEPLSIRSTSIDDDCEVGLALSPDNCEKQLSFQPSNSFPTVENAKAIVKVPYSKDPILSLINEKINSTNGPQTPPPRSRHSTDYLKQVGLLYEGTGETPLAKNHAAEIAKDFAESNFSDNSSNIAANVLEEFEDVTIDEPIVPDPMIDKLVLKISSIQYDLPRTFPTYAFYHDHGAMHIGLERVLLCYALYNPAIGYLQGMSFLVATLLLCMDEYETFKCLTNLLSRRLLYDFYTVNHVSIDNYIRCFDEYFKKFLPLLYNHFQEESVSSRMFLMDWIITLFTKALPLEIATQVWDAYLFEGESYLLCVGLGILKMFAHILSKFTLEKIPSFLMHLPTDIKIDELFSCISQINISKKQYEKIRQKIMKESQQPDVTSRSTFSTPTRPSLKPSSNRIPIPDQSQNTTTSPNRSSAYPNYMLSHNSLKLLKHSLMLHANQHQFAVSHGAKLSPSRSTSHLPDSASSPSSQSGHTHIRSNSQGTPSSSFHKATSHSSTHLRANSGSLLSGSPEKKYKLSNDAEKASEQTQSKPHHEQRHTIAAIGAFHDAQTKTTNGDENRAPEYVRASIQNNSEIPATNGNVKRAAKKRYDYCVPS